MLPDGSPVTVTNLAGTGARAFGGDEGPGNQAKLDLPSSVVVDTQRQHHHLRPGQLPPAPARAQRHHPHDLPAPARPAIAGDGGPAIDGGAQRPEGAVGAAGRPHRDRRAQPHLHRRHRQPRDPPASTRSATSRPSPAPARPGYSGDGGPATAAQLDTPSDVAVAPNGTLYIADTMNNAVRNVTPDGTIDTFAGTGERGFSGDGGPRRPGRAGSALRRRGRRRTATSTSPTPTTSASARSPASTCPPPPTPRADPAAGDHSVHRRGRLDLHLCRHRRHAASPATAGPPADDALLAVRHRVHPVGPARLPRLEQPQGARDPARRHHPHHHAAPTSSATARRT